MKHITFNFCEPIVGVQRVRNVVFSEGEHTIACYNAIMRKRLVGALKDLQIKCKLADNGRIILLDDYRIVLDEYNLDEFYIVRGCDEMEILDSIDVFNCKEEYL